MLGEITLQGFLFKRKLTIPPTKAEEIRNMNISAQIHSAISSAILGGGSVDSIRDSIGKGFKMGKEQVQSLEDNVEYRSEYFQYGDPDSVARIKEIESDLAFDKWIDEVAIEDIKRSVPNS